MALTLGSVQASKAAGGASEQSIAPIFGSAEQAASWDDLEKKRRMSGSGPTFTNFSTSPTRDAGSFAAPASLPVNVIAANEARRRRALSDYEEASITGTNQMGRIDADRIAASKELAAQAQNIKFRGMSSLAAAGQARSPRFADRLRRELTRSELSQRSQLQRQASMQMASIQEMIAAARRARDRQLLELEGDEVLQRTELDRIFTPPTFRST